MSQNNMNPFVFSAGFGHVPPAQPQQNNTHVSNMESATQQAGQQNSVFSGVDMSALEGISPAQLAAIARLFQSGALQAPPPLPSLPVPANSSSSSRQPPPPPPPPPQTSTTGPTGVDVDMDTEEGEVDESEESGTPAKGRDFLRPPPTGPRNRSLSPRQRLQGNFKQRASPRPVAASSQTSKSPLSQPDQTPQATPATNGNRAVTKGQAARMFLLEMVKAGYSYEKIVPEFKNTKALDRLFKELGLPIPSASSSSKPPQSNGGNDTQRQLETSSAKTSATEESRKISLSTRPLPVKPAPADRNEYLARLQAAKNKKTDSVALPPSTPSEAEPQPPARSEYLARLQAAKSKKPNAVASADAPKSPKLDQPPTLEADATTTQNSKPAQAPVSADIAITNGQPSPAGKAAKTELVRQRLEAFKAQRAKQSREAESSPIPKPASTEKGEPVASSPLASGLGAGLANISSQVHGNMGGMQRPPPTQLLTTGYPPVAQSSVSPTPQTPSRSFSSLPGLFMFGADAQAQDSSQPTQPSLAPQPGVESVLAAKVPEIATAAKSQHVIESRATSVPRKRPVASDFDDAPATRSLERRLFGQSRNVSEDESLVIQVSDDEEDDEMEIDGIPVPSSQTRLQTKSFRDVGPLRDFPPKPSLQAQTSAPGTPGGTIYAQKMKELEDLKRKLAEKERRQKVNGKGAVPGSDTPDANVDAGISGGVAIESGVGTPDSRITTKAESKSLAIGSLPIDSLIQPPAQTVVPLQSPNSTARRSLSAAQSAKLQERERLRLRLLELEREEVEAVDEGGEIGGTAVDSDHVMSGALPDALSLQSNEVIQSPPQANQDEPKREDVLHSPASEEGEISDDSLSNLYEPQDTLDAGSQVQSAAEHVTVEPLKTGDIATGQMERTPASESQPQQHIQPETGVVEQESGSIPTTMSAVDNRMPDTLVGGSATEAMPQDSPASQGYSASDESMEDGEVEDESEEDDGPIDVSTPPYLQDTGSALDGMPRGHNIEESALDDQETEDNMSSPMAEDSESDLNPSAEVNGLREYTDDGIADIDLAPELQPSNDEAAIAPIQDHAQSKAFFTPYRSPLAMFKDYRYHPDYLSTVAGGYKSITYSQQVDPYTPLCPYETAGGKCNDDTCQNQHFKIMVVSDNELLKAMGTKDVPARDPDELKRWNEGLGAVVRELRNTNLGKDANAIATRIAAYRREFVGDPTKILNL